MTKPLELKFLCICSWVGKVELVDVDIFIAEVGLGAGLVFNALLVVL